MSGGDAWPAPWAGECAADAGLLMGCLLSSTVQRAHGPGRGPCVSGASGAGGAGVGPAGGLGLFLWGGDRSGEGRGGEEGRFRGGADYLKKKNHTAELSAVLRPNDLQRKQ